MEGVKVHASAIKGHSRKLLRGWEIEPGMDKARSLSRKTGQNVGRTRLEESRTFVGTPRGSIVEPLYASKSTLNTSKIIRLLSAKKDPGSVEKAKSKKGQKDKKKKELTSTSKKTLEREMRSKEKEAIVRLTADRHKGEMKSNPHLMKKGLANKKKGEKKPYGTMVFKDKEAYAKAPVKKKYTLDDDDMLYHFDNNPWASKINPTSPKEDSLSQTKWAIERIEKCLGGKQIRQVNDTKMKKSFKGDLSTKIKIQAMKMERKTSKEIDGPIPAVDDLCLMVNSNREYASKGSRELFLDEFFPNVATELSESTEKRITAVPSPSKGIKKQSKKLVRDLSIKQTPHQRLSRSKKMDGVPFSATKKDLHNRSQERKTKKTSGEFNMLRLSQQQPKIRTTKVSKQAIPYLDNTVEKSNKGLLFFQTLQQLRPSNGEVCKIKLATRATLDKIITTASFCETQPQPCTISMNSLPPCPSSNPLLLPTKPQDSGLKNSVRESPEKVFESKPDYPDQKLIYPLEVGDLGTAPYFPETSKTMPLAEASEQDRMLFQSSILQGFADLKCYHAPRLPMEEFMEDILNLPLEPTSKTPIKESKERRRVQPRIMNRHQSGLYTSTNHY